MLHTHTEKTDCDHDHRETLQQIVTDWKQGDPVVAYTRRAGQPINEAPHWVMCLSNQEAMELIIMLTHACHLPMMQVVTGIVMNKENMERNFGAVRADNEADRAIEDLIKQLNIKKQ